MGMKNIRILCLFFSLITGSAYTQQITDAQLDGAIARGVQYLNGRIDSGRIYYLVVPLLAPLADYYHLPLSQGGGDLGNRLTDTLQRRQWETYRQMMAFDKRRQPQLPLPLSTLDGVNLYALYCGKALRQKTFLQYMDSSRVYGGYDLTHAYLAALLLRNTRCLCQRHIDRLYPLLLGDMRLLVPAPAVSSFSDLDMEVMALLLYANERMLISEALVSRVLQAQQPDGAWKDADVESRDFTDHTTTLALWVLLEWKYADDLRLFLPYAKTNPVMH